MELRRGLWTYIRKLLAEGMSIVLTTRNLEVAEEHADWIGIIDRDQLLLPPRPDGGAHSQTCTRPPRSRPHPSRRTDEARLNARTGAGGG